MVLSARHVRFARVSCRQTFCLTLGSELLHLQNSSPRGASGHLLLLLKDTRGVV